MDKKKLEEQLQDLKKNFQNRNVWTILLGAGASKDASYLTMSELCDNVIKKIAEKKSKESHESLILDLYNFRKDENQNKTVTIENVLDDLYRLSLVKSNRSQIEISYPLSKKVDEETIKKAIIFVKNDVINSFKNITPKTDTTLKFIKYWFTGSRYMRIFTTNWDPLIESASDELLDSNDLQIRCIDGFRGIINKKLDFDLYEETITSNVHEYIHRLDLIKLHGSLDWYLKNGTIRKNTQKEEIKNEEQVMIYPTPSKAKESFGYPYAELFRIFSNNILDSQQCKYLLCIGVSFPDDHINSIIAQSLKRKKEDFNLYTIDPNLNHQQIRSVFGDSKAIQEPINITFSQLVKYLTEDIIG